MTRAGGGGGISERTCTLHYHHGKSEGPRAIGGHGGPSVNRSAAERRCFHRMRESRACSRKICEIWNCNATACCAAWEIKFWENVSVCEGAAKLFLVSARGLDSRTAFKCNACGHGQLTPRQHFASETNLFAEEAVLSKDWRALFGFISGSVASDRC